MVLFRKKRARRSKKKSTIFFVAQFFFYALFLLTRYVVTAPTILAVIALVSFSSWFYYSGEYHELASDIDDFESSISKQAGLVLKDILLEGQKYTSKDDILGAITIQNNNSESLTIGEPLGNIDLQKTKEKLEDLTWVKYAEVERQLPSTLSIRMIEKIPTALWQNNGEVSLIDSDGEIIHDKSLDNFSDLIILVGKDVPSHAGSLLKMIKRDKDTKNMVSSAIRVSKRRWNIRMHNGIEVKLPEKDAGQAWEFLTENHKETKILDSNIRNIDLRIADKMYVQ